MTSTRPSKRRRSGRVDSSVVEDGLLHGWYEYVVAFTAPIQALLYTPQPLPLCHPCTLESADNDTIVISL